MAATPLSQPAPGKADDPSPGLQLLVVDDEAGVRRIVALALTRAGFGVRVAASGGEAVEVYREHWRTIDLVLLDVLMPGGLDGPHTLAALQEINPAVRCCFMSGHTAHYPIHKLLALGALNVLFKPFANLAELRQTLRELAQADGLAG
jgi:DNA-binding NtrC family response regulator